jgi:hypothetical protein
MQASKTTTPTERWRPRHAAPPIVKFYDRNAESEEVFPVLCTLAEWLRVEAEDIARPYYLAREIEC